MSASEASDFGDIRGQGETLLYITRWSKLPLVGWNLLAAPFYLAGVTLLLDASVRDKGFIALVIAVLISGLACAAWIGRSVIVSNRRVIYHAALSKSVSAVPLDKIVGVERSPGVVVVRAGSIFTTLTLWVPDAPALESAIEAARAGAPHQPGPTGPSRTTNTLKDVFSRPSEPSRGEKVAGFVLLGVIAVSLGYYFMGRETSVSDGLTDVSSATSAGQAFAPVPALSDGKSIATVEAACLGLQSLAVNLAQARNQGVPQSIALHELTRNAQDDMATELLTTVVQLVYSNSNVSAENLGAMTYLTCLRALAEKN